MDYSNDPVGNGLPDLEKANAFVGELNEFNVRMFEKYIRDNQSK